MLNELLREQLSEQRRKRDAVRDDSSAAVDNNELVNPYTRWTLGVRTLVRLRYISVKKALLGHLRQHLQFDVTVPQVQHRILQQVRQDSNHPSWWPLLLSPGLVYSAVFVALFVVSVVVYSSIASARQEAVFKHTVPEYSDRVYALKAQRVRDSADSDALARLEGEIITLRASIIDYFAGLPTLQTALQSLFEGIESQDGDAQALIHLVKPINDYLYNRKIPYYLSTMSKTAFCADLPAERFIARLFGGEKSSGEVCQVHALLSFHVDDDRYYAQPVSAPSLSAKSGAETSKTRNHLALFTRRLDEQELYDNFLGLVHLGDDRAQVFLSNIDNASADSLNAVSDGALKTKLMPEGMPDVYGLESLASRLQTRVINQYVEDIEQRWWRRLPSLWQELSGGKADTLGMAGKRLQNRVADATAFHEVQHLIDQADEITEPEWYGDTVTAFGKVTSNEKMREHILWELSAFFTHLAYAGELQGVILNDLTAIALDPMLQNQPHFYSVRIILPILHEQLEGDFSDEILPARSLAEVARAYKALATNAEQISDLARAAYQRVFERPLPMLGVTRLPPKKIFR